MVYAGIKNGAVLQCIDLLRRDFETHEVHGSGLIGSGAIEVLIGNRDDAVHVTDLKPYLIFDTNHLAESHRTLCGIRYLNHKCRFPIMAIGDERIIRAEFLLNTLSFKYALYAEHFLNLIADGGCILEVEPNMLAEGQLSVFFVRHHLCAEVRAPG